MDSAARREMSVIPPLFDVDFSSAEALAGDEVLDRWVRVHHTSLRRIALRLTGSRGDADDLVQETFVRALRVLRRRTSIVHERAWLCTILNRLFIDHCRARSRERPLRDEHHEQEAVPEEEEQAPEWAGITVEQVRAAVERLDHDFRVVFCMYEFERRPYAEIAERLGIRKVTVGTRLMRARNKLRQMLQCSAAEEDGQ